MNQIDRTEKENNHEKKEDTNQKEGGRSEGYKMMRPISEGDMRT